MPRLDARLTAVAKQIRAEVHVDVGSDHGGLLVRLLQSKRIEFGIAIESNLLPFQNSVNALEGFSGEARLGNGLQPLGIGEADSLSICGMGAELMVAILEAFPDRVPDEVVLQPNKKPELIRKWAFENQFHFVDEQVTEGLREFTVLSFRNSKTNAKDPAYDGVDRTAALTFGPLILKRCDSRFQTSLREEESYWSKLDQLKPDRQSRLKLVRSILADLEIGTNRE